MNSDILKTAKMLMGIKDNAQDDIILLYVDMAIQDTLNYLNRAELPVQLRHTIARIVRLQMTGALVDGYEAPIASLSEAGRSVSFATAQMTEAAIKTENDAITRQLNGFRLMFRD